MNLQALLELVEAHRQRQCAHALAAAREEAAAIVHQAHRDARQYVRSQLEAGRESARRQIAAAEAHFATLQRRQRQQQGHALLAQSWPMLQAELAKRWQDAALRRAWVENIFARALCVLPRTTWVIFHPADWPPSEHDSATLAAPPRFAADAGIRAGLRIAADGTVLDGTLDGLLSDRSVIEARLLAHLEAMP